MRILLVEDAPPVANVMMRLLNMLGHEVRMCNCGFDAVAELTQTSEHDLVIADFRLPDMNALDLLASANIPDCVGVIVYTGGDALESILHNCGRRVVGLPKPFSIAQLTNAISCAAVADSFSLAACV